MLSDCVNLLLVGKEESINKTMQSPLRVTMHTFPTIISLLFALSLLVISCSVLFKKTRDLGNSSLLHDSTIPQYKYKESYVFMCGTLVCLQKHDAIISFIIIILTTMGVIKLLMKPD